MTKSTQDRYLEGFNLDMQIKEILSPERSTAISPQYGIGVFPLGRSLPMGLTVIAGEKLNKPIEINCIVWSGAGIYTRNMAQNFEQTHSYLRTNRWSLGSSIVAGELQYQPSQTINIDYKSQKDIGFILQNIRNRLRCFSELEEGWDSYQAKKISSYAMSQALMLFANVVNLDPERKANISEPFLVPLASGGIQVEWETIYKKFNFRIPASSDKAWEYMSVDLRDGSEGGRKFGHADSADNILDIAKEWLFGL